MFTEEAKDAAVGSADHFTFDKVSALAEVVNDPGPGIEEYSPTSCPYPETPIDVIHEHRESLIHMSDPCDDFTTHEKTGTHRLLDFSQAVVIKVSHSPAPESSMPGEEPRQSGQLPQQYFQSEKLTAGWLDRAVRIEKLGTYSARFPIMREEVDHPAEGAFCDYSVRTEKEDVISPGTLESLIHPRGESPVAATGDDFDIRRHSPGHLCAPVAGLVIHYDHLDLDVSSRFHNRPETGTDKMLAVPGDYDDGESN
jgi:hypothetical protein